MGRDIIARGMASGAIKVNINAGHVFVDNTARDVYFVTNPTELVENMYVYCDSKLQQYDGSIWIDRTPAIKGETGTGVPTGGTTNQVLTKNSNGDYDFSWVDLAAGGDMVKSLYDTANKQVDVYDMDNMEDGTTYVKTENNYDDTDKAKVDALDLDTIATHVEDSDIHGAYSMLKQVVAEDGYIATYQLTKNGTPLGSKINIPKDYLVKSGTLETCSQNDVPVSGYIIGDKYLDFIVNTTENTGNQTHIYIKVTDLIDIYTEGNGIDITNNSISIAINSVSNGLFVDSGGVGLNLATSNSNGAFSSGEKTKLNNIKKTVIAEITGVIEALNWSDTAPHTQNITLSVPGHTITDADYDINIYRISNATEATDKLEIEAYSYIDKAVISANNTLTLTAYDYKPLTDINVKIEVVKKW